MKNYEITLRKIGEGDRVIGRYDSRKEALVNFYNCCDKGLWVDVHSVENYQQDRTFTTCKDTHRSYGYGRKDADSL